MWMLRVVKSNETSQIAVVTESKTINGENLSSTRREASRHFRNKRGDVRETKLISLQGIIRTLETILGDK
jgi:hypothetical protein